MISATTRAEIKGFLEGFVHGMVIEHKTPTRKASDIRPTRSYSAKGDIKPFHEALLPEGILRINEFERSFSTKLGTTFEECARLIGKGHYAKAIRGYRTEGKVSQDAIRIIEASVNWIGTNGMARPYPEIVKEVLNAKGPREVTRAQISDLYLQDTSGNEVFFEMKSPQPNKGQCLEVAERFLTIHAVRQAGPPHVKTFYAMAYNPYGADKTAYKWSFATRYMDINNEVLIGKEFWDFIAGAGTYDELLEIYREVGREKGPDILDQLALDY
jgi:hypothetical protein